MSEQDFKLLNLYREHFKPSSVIYGKPVEQNSNGFGIGKKDYEVQSVIFKRPSWTKKSSSDWIKKNGFRNQGVDEKGDHYRYRQIDPHYIESKGYTHYVTKKLPHDIDLIIAYKGKKGGMIVRSFPERKENHF
jgi:hypothetical protein